MKNLIATMVMGLVATACAGIASASTAEQKAGLKAATQMADADYKVSRVKCDAFTGNPGAVCNAEAKAQRVRADTDAKVRFDDSLKTRTDGRKAVADAEFDVSKTRCKSQNGNEKDVCIKQAKAVKVAALADAKADKKVIDARDDAEHDKAKAQYKVALEQCDGYAGKVKDACVSDAKFKFAQ